MPMRLVLLDHLKDQDHGQQDIIEVTHLTRLGNQVLDVIHPKNANLMETYLQKEQIVQLEEH